MRSFEIDQNLETYNSLIAAHAEKHRAYHTSEHINACLNWLDQVRHLCERPHEIEMAFWFHDAIYKPMSKSNEADSADWAVRFLSRNDVEPAIIDRVDHMIQITAGHESTECDPAIMLDIDLSILGSPDHVYDAYEKHIRFEYKWVPGIMYRKGRKSILEDFLGRERIFNTDFFSEALEAQAKENLARAISRL